MKRIYIIVIMCTSLCSIVSAKIDRKALVERNSPIITAFDSLSSLTVGNGNFAVTVDATGLQSYPERYVNGIPLNAMSDWAWHSFPNSKKLKHEETERTLDLGHGRKETYAVEYKTAGRNKDATEYFRVNPHRLCLGTVGLLFTDSDGKKMDIDQLKGIRQRLDLWNGLITSEYAIDGKSVKVLTGSFADKSGFYSKIETPLIAKGRAKVAIRFSYPTGKHADNGNDWSKTELHSSTIIAQTAQSAIIERKVDSTLYYIKVEWEGNASISEVSKHEFVLSSKGKALSFSVVYSLSKDVNDNFSFAEAMSQTSVYWKGYWQQGAAVDFSDCTDPRARELERRVVLSQYLTAVNCTNNMPPQETGLTYNTWFGRPHLEMTFWHGVHFALWNRPKVLKQMLQWYNDKAAPVARKIAERQGFKGMRWMKMTDPDAGEAPSNTGSFLLWQQPHYIYMAEEMYRANPSPETIALYADNVEATAEFIADFAKSCKPNDFAHSCKPGDGGKIKLFGATAMQESMSKDFSFNHPFEQAYWHYALSVAQRWRERQGGKPRNMEWDEIIANLAPLTFSNGRYLSGEPLDSFLTSSSEEKVNAFDPFATPSQYGRKRISEEEFLLKSRSDHPAVLGVAGIFPSSPLYERDKMEKTLEWVMANWNWAATWGWDYGMVAMCATSVGRPDIALNALLIDEQKNTYLANGHNYQEPKRLRLYLPGNGALLTAVAMMCAGWDGNETANPGFPKDGKWNVRWEGLKRMQAY